MNLKGLLLRSTAVVVSLALSGLGGELAVRVYAKFNDHLGELLRQFDPMRVKIVAHGQFGYRQRPNSTYHYRNGLPVATSNRMGYRGPIVAVPKPGNTFRIILLGESTTHGWGVGDDETIDAYMRGLLNERYPDNRFEVVNLAFDGYDSYQLLERLSSQGMELEPDLIIVNSGINEVRNTRFKNLANPDRRTLIWENVLQRLRVEQARGGPTMWTRIKHHFYVARLPEIFRQYRSKSQANEERKQITPNLEVLDIFRRNLEHIASIANEARVPVIFSTPPSALSLSYAPDATSEISYWVINAATTQRLRDDLAREMQRVAVREAGKGRKVAYISHQLSPDLFLDDCHLTPSGNRQMALDFVSMIDTHFRDLLPIQAFAPSSTTV